MRISKGVIMPTLPYWALKLIAQADVVNAHVPQPDAALIAMISRLLGRPFVLTYQCDLKLPKGLIHNLANQGSNVANHISSKLADVIVTTSMDYAENSLFLQRYLEKVQPILPPIQLESVTEDNVAAFRAKYGIDSDQRIVGMAARLATEKGVEYLVHALPSVLERYPNVRVLFAGQHLDVLGEENYARKLEPLIQRLGNHWTFLGILPSDEWAVFFHEAEVTVLPSINSTEAFGMVQIESMTSGTPVIATDLPGIRQPILITGMGIIVPPRSSDALAQALITILDSPDGYLKDPRMIKNVFAPEIIAEQYEELYRELL
jgi:glycosyltransferase involved in cell wall biosynthesis